MEIDGFYAGYFAARAGEGVALFVFCDGVVTGADDSAVTYDGTFELKSSGYADVEITVNLPPRLNSIVGITTGDQGKSFSVRFSLPPSFSEQPYIRIETPYGPVNARFKKIRELAKK